MSSFKHPMLVRHRYPLVASRTAKHLDPSLLEATLGAISGPANTTSNTKAARARLASLRIAEVTRREQLGAPSANEDASAAGRHCFEHGVSLHPPVSLRTWDFVDRMRYGLRGHFEAEERGEVEVVGDHLEQFGREAVDLGHATERSIQSPITDGFMTVRSHLKVPVLSWRRRSGVDSADRKDGLKHSRIEVPSPRGS